MECYECGDPATGICIDCGVGLCANHGEIVQGHRDVLTGTLTLTHRMAARWFVCKADAPARHQAALR